VENMQENETGGRTQRLIIRIMERRDIEAARLMHNADDTLLYLSDVEHISEAQQDKWFNNLSLSPCSRRYTVIEADSGDFVGVFRADNLDWKNRSVCVGLDIERSKRGKRYSYEIYHYFLNYFFTQCGLHRAYLATLDTNELAQKLYMNLGFSIEGRSRGALFRDGSFKDLIWMSMLASEYLDRENSST